jgi:hypothetical protein
LASKEEWEERAGYNWCWVYIFFSYWGGRLIIFTCVCLGLASYFLSFCSVYCVLSIIWLHF